MKSRLAREAKWFGGGFLLPFLAVLAADLLTSRSPMPAWKRVLYLEDICTYAMCLVLPSMVYLAASLVRFGRAISTTRKSE